MKQNKLKRKESKGITLIALVITIIVLLILAAVSIATLTGQNGLITQADKAKTETTKEAAKEKVAIEVLGSYGTNGKIDIDLLNKNLKENIKGLTYNGSAISETNKITKLPATVLVDGYDVTINSDGNVAVAGGTLAKDILKIDSTATEAKDKSPYVKYNGMNCRVFYNDETHGLQIITEGNLEERMPLGYRDGTGADVKASDFAYDGSATIDDNFRIAAVSYNNVVDNLNNKAKRYMDSKGIATDARSLGSIPTLASNSKFYGDTSGMWSGIDPETGDDAYLSWGNLFKIGEKNYMEDVKQINDLGLKLSSGYTWLASRNINVFATNLSVGVYGLMSWMDEASVSVLLRVKEDGSTESDLFNFGFRPVFLLSPDVVVASGDGTSENPYIIK